MDRNIIVITSILDTPWTNIFTNFPQIKLPLVPFNRKMLSSVVQNAQIAKILAMQNLK